MEELLSEVRLCQVCAPSLGHAPRPVVSAHPASRIAIIGQAPGAVVNRTGIPWDDQSGDNLRSWLSVDRATFYNSRKFALIPMGFCYPGKGKSGDLPPRKECAPLWHEKIFGQMNDLVLTLLVGKYAQTYYLTNAQPSLTATVRNFREYLPRLFPLPHPSPRNNIWQSKNQWFTTDLLPVLQQHVKAVLAEK